MNIEPPPPVHSSSPQPTHQFYVPSISTCVAALEQQSYEVELDQAMHQFIEPAHKDPPEPLDAVVKETPEILP